MKTKKQQKLGKLQLKWVKALESGKFRKSTGDLRNKKGFCCLGVLEKLEGNLAKRKPGNSYCFLNNDMYNSSNLSKKTKNKYGFYGSSGQFKNDVLVKGYSRLTTINDSEKFSFKQIAKIIRDNPSLVFKKSV